MLRQHKFLRSITKPTQHRPSNNNIFHGIKIWHENSNSLFLSYSEIADILTITKTKYEKTQGLFF